MSRKKSTKIILTPSTKSFERTGTWHRKRGFRSETIIYMQKRGSWMCLWRQIGHLPGLVSRSLFLNLNPHFLHSAGIIIRRALFFWVDIRICPRWSTTSFSEIPISADISRADKIRSVRTKIISWRIVSCFSGETKGSLGLIFIYVTKSGPNLSKQAGICDQVQPSA